MNPLRGTSIGTVSTRTGGVWVYVTDDGDVFINVSSEGYKPAQILLGKEPATELAELLGHAVQIAEPLAQLNQDIQQKRQQLIDEITKETP